MNKMRPAAPGNSRAARGAVRAVLLSALFFLGGCAALLTPPHQSVHLDSTAVDGEARKITARVYRPQSPGPYPVVIDLHGCSGIVAARNRAWVERFTHWGYAVVKVDSFNPRGDGNICDDTLKIPPLQRLNDIESAIRHALREPDLDAGNIFVAGMSHGGTTAMLVHYEQRPLFARLRGVVAFYPYCMDSLPSLVADTLILIGELDDWTPAQFCRRMTIGTMAEHTLELVVYPGVYHSFDVPGAGGIYYGHRLGYDAAATRDSVARVRAFLARRLAPAVDSMQPGKAR